MIDILLPFYGDPQLMRETVCSVLAQTSPDWHLHVVDDGHPDPAVATWFEALDHPQITYRRNPRNLGANANYRHALTMATAPHVVVMGADDVMLPNYVEVIQDALGLNPNAAVVQCGVEVIDECGRRVLPLVDRVKSRLRPRVDAPTCLRREQALTSLLTGNWTYFPSLCWRTETIQGIGFRTGFNVVQDLALLVDVLLDGGELCVAPEIAFQYRRHAGSDSAVKTLQGSRFEEERRYHDLISQRLRTLGLARAARAAKLRPTSRLHALALLPGTVRRRERETTARLLDHALR